MTTSTTELSKKTSGPQLRIPEKPRIGCWAFQKNLRPVAEDSGKRADRLLSFSKKPQVRCWGFRKNRGSVA